MYEILPKTEKGFKTIDDVFETIGYGKKQLKAIGLVGLILMNQGLYLNLINSLLIPLKESFKVDDSQIGLASSLIFLGFALSSSFAGLTDFTLGRKLTIEYSLVLLFTLQQIMAYNTNYLIFLILIFAIGISLGLSGLITINILCEFLPIHYRAFILNSVWTWYSLGQILVLLIIYHFMPNLEPSGIRSVYITSAFLPLLTLLMIAVFLEDSPRNLILQKSYEEARRILESITGKELSDLEFNSIKSNVELGANNKVETSINSLFSPQYKRLTLILAFIWFANSVINYGPYLIVSLVMEQLGIDSAESLAENHTSIVINQIYIACFGLIANPIAGVMCELKYFGRRNAAFIGYSLGLIFSLYIIYDPSYISTCLGMINICATMGYNIVISYTAEVYPTKVRDISAGFMNTIGSIGCFSSQFMFLYLLHLNVFAPFWALTLIMLVVAFCYLMLPVETYGIALDN